MNSLNQNAKDSVYTIFRRNEQVFSGTQFSIEMDEISYSHIGGIALHNRKWGVIVNTIVFIPNECGEIGIIEIHGNDLPELVNTFARTKQVMGVSIQSIGWNESMDHLIAYTIR